MVTAGTGRGSGPRPLRRVAAAFLAGAACAAVTACGAGQAARAVPAYEVRAGAVAGLGRVLTDGRGFTVYIYVPDHRGRSRCSGVCAVNWPPLLLPAGVNRPLAGPGVDPAMLGASRMPGGARQVTYHGWPLYLWHRDRAPGQATGQAEDMGLWYVLSVSGSVNRRPLPGNPGEQPGQS